MLERWSSFILRLQDMMMALIVTYRVTKEKDRLRVKIRMWIRLFSLYLNKPEKQTFWESMSLDELLILTHPPALGDYLEGFSEVESAQSLNWSYPFRLFCRSSFPATAWRVSILRHPIAYDIQFFFWELPSADEYTMQIARSTTNQKA